MKLLLDEMHSPKVARILSGKGIDIVTAAEVGLGGSNDDFVLAVAAELKRAVVTENARISCLFTARLWRPEVSTQESCSLTPSGSHEAIANTKRS